VRIGDTWYDADTCAEIQRLIDEHDARNGGLADDRYFVLENGQTPHELLDATGLSDQEIVDQFGMGRDQLVASLGMPSQEELAIFDYLCATQHAVHSRVE
jgi:hypothetical protein